MKQVLKKIIPQKMIQKMRNRYIRDNANELVYIHIGKCGGASLWSAINESELVKEKFTTVHKVHIRKPPILKYAKYIIVIRNPISRAISAFNWRYYLVVEDEAQRHRFQGEWEILKKYQTLNNLAEGLYENGDLKNEVAIEFQAIHHLQENIQFYLSGLLESITERQLFAVLATETLGDDVIKQLDVKSIKRTHENGKFVDSSKKYLSEIAYKNLKHYLREDYRCIEKLLALKELTICEPSKLLE